LKKKENGIIFAHRHIYENERANKENIMKKIVFLVGVLCVLMAVVPFQTSCGDDDNQNDNNSDNNDNDSGDDDDNDSSDDDDNDSSDDDDNDSGDDDDNDSGK
jgi:hypothetical protein